MKQNRFLKRIPWMLLALLLVTGLVSCGRSAPVRETTEAAPTPAEGEPTVVVEVTEPLTTTLEPLPSATESETPTMGMTVTLPMTPTLPMTSALGVTATLPAEAAATQLPAAGTPGLYVVVGVSPGQVLNIRQQPGVSNATVGKIPASGTGVEVTGAGQQVDGAQWLPVRYGDVTGWVNASYLAQQVGTAEPAVAARATSIVNALKDKNWQRLAKYVHPQEGVRFSPYSYVRADPNATEKDLAFRAKRIPTLWKDNTVREWGTFDGSGKPISMTFKQYFDRFVYDADFAQAPVVGFNQRIGQSTTLDNIAEVYPGAAVVEYHFPGFDPQYEGRDWKSLRLVLKEMNGTWYLVGIVHDEATM